MSKWSVESFHVNGNLFIYEINALSLSQYDVINFCSFFLKTILLWEGKERERSINSLY